MTPLTPLRIVEPWPEVPEAGMMWRVERDDEAGRECWWIVLPQTHPDLGTPGHPSWISFRTTDRAAKAPHEMWDISGTPPLISVSPSIDVERWVRGPVDADGKPTHVRDGSYWHGHIVNGQLDPGVEPSQQRRAMTDVHVRHIPETVVEGKRLGRHVRHDPRSLQYLHADGTAATVRWERKIQVLDQGNVGSCTGNAATGVLGTEPDYDDLSTQLAAGLVLDESEALKLYSAAEDIDGDGPYPPNDNGSSGLSVAQAAKAAGLCSGYQHATTIAQAHTAIQAGPVMIGSNWYDSMDSPDANGLVAIAEGATVRGGHEYESIGYDAGTDLWECVNSWGESFGVGGHFFMSSATLERLLSEEGDITSLTPISQPAPTPTPSPTPPSPTPDPPTPPTPTPPTPQPGPTPPPPNPDGSPTTFALEVRTRRGEGAVQIPVDPTIITQIEAKCTDPLQRMRRQPMAVVSPAPDDPSETLVTVTNAMGMRQVTATITYVDPNAGASDADPAPTTFELDVPVSDGEGWQTMPVVPSWITQVATSDEAQVSTAPATEDPEHETCVTVTGAAAGVTSVHVVITFVDPNLHSAA